MDQVVTGLTLFEFRMTYLLCHHAHLFTSNGGLGLIVHLFSNFFQEAHEVQKNQTQALQQRLRDLLRHDPVRTRRLTWHATQIISIAREKAVLALCKTTLIFTGYLYFLTAVRYGTLRGDGGLDRPVPLDGLPWSQDPDEVAEVEAWIQVGGPAAVGSIPDICDDGCFPTLKTSAIRTIQDLQPWELNKKFCKIIDSFPW